MRAVFTAQLLQLKHNPWTVIIMLVLSIMLTIFIGGVAFDKVTVRAIPEADLSETRTGQLLELLNDSDRFFQILTANTAGTLSQFDYQSRKKMLRWMLASDRYTLSWDSVRGEETDGRLLLTDEEKSLLG